MIWALKEQYLPLENVRYAANAQGLKNAANETYEFAGVAGFDMFMGSPLSIPIERVEEVCDALSRDSEYFTVYMGDAVRECYGSHYADELNKIVAPYGYEVRTKQYGYSSIEFVKSNEI